MMKKVLMVFFLAGILLTCRNETPPPDEPDPETPDPPSVSGRVTDQDFTYLGAFRLPEVFAWGALGMCHDPGGNSGTGTLLITGLTTRPAEFGVVSIPQPQCQSDWTQLPEADLISGPRSFDGNLVEAELGATAEYASASGIEIVAAQGSQQTAKLYGSIDCWYCVAEETFNTLFMSELDGSHPRGMYHVGPRDLPFHGNKSGDFLFKVSDAYAARYLGGRNLITGKTRGAFNGSMGPTLFAVRPWDSEEPSGNLDAVALLWYRLNWDCASPNVTGKSLCDYPDFTMCDKWEGGAYVETDGRAAIVLWGRKGLGNNGYGEPPAGACSLYKGYHCDPYERQAIFYDVLELAEVAAGQRDPWSVRPYLTWRPEEFYNRDAQGHACGELGGVAYDPLQKRIYVIEKSLPAYNADDQAVVHVWQVN